MSPEQIIEKAKRLIKQNLLDKKTDDFLMLAPAHRHFLFTMRMHYLNEEDEAKPFKCSEGQLKFMSDLIKSAKTDNGVSKEVYLALHTAVMELESKLGQDISKKAKELSITLGMDKKKISDELWEELFKR